jgi:hypothetical protein
VKFFDADGLAGKDRAEGNLFAAQTNAAAISDDDGLIVKRTIDNRCRAILYRREWKADRPRLGSSCSELREPHTAASAR